jgi:hypothetical protein
MAGNSSVPWVAVTVSDLQNAQAGALVLAFQTTALGQGQSDPTAQVLTDVSAELLGAVGFSGRYTMDASQGTFGAGVPDLIPPNLKSLVVNKVVRIMRGRLEMVATAMQIEDEKTYQRTLDRIRLGQYPVDATNNPSGSDISVRPGLVALNYGNRRHFRPGQLDNL